MNVVHFYSLTNTHLVFQGLLTMSNGSEFEIQIKGAVITKFNQPNV